LLIATQGYSSSTVSNLLEMQKWHFKIEIDEIPSQLWVSNYPHPKRNINYIYIHIPPIIRDQANN